MPSLTTGAPESEERRRRKVQVLEYLAWNFSQEDIDDLGSEKRREEVAAKMLPNLVGDCETPEQMELWYELEWVSPRYPECRRSFIRNVLLEYHQEREKEKVADGAPLQ